MWRKWKEESPEFGKKKIGSLKRWRKLGICKKKSQKAEKKKDEEENEKLTAWRTLAASGDTSSWTVTLPLWKSERILSKSFTQHWTHWNLNCNKFDQIFTEMFLEKNLC